MQSHIGYICLTFPHCAFSCVSSNGLPERMQSHIGYICLTFPHCACSCVSSNCLPKRMQIHIGCICLAFLHCAVVVAKCLHQNICLKFLHCPPLFPLDLSNWTSFFVHNLDPSTASAHSKLTKIQDKFWFAQGGQKGKFNQRNDLFQ